MRESIVHLDTTLRIADVKDLIFARLLLYHLDVGHVHNCDKEAVQEFSQRNCIGVQDLHQHLRDYCKDIELDENGLSPILDELSSNHGTQGFTHLRRKIN